MTIIIKSQGFTGCSLKGTGTIVLVLFNKVTVRKTGDLLNFIFFLLFFFFESHQKPVMVNKLGFYVL